MQVLQVKKHRNENKELTVKCDKYVQYDFNGNGGAVDFYAGTANDHRVKYKEYASYSKDVR